MERKTSESDIQEVFTRLLSLCNGEINKIQCLVNKEIKECSLHDCEQEWQIDVYTFLHNFVRYSEKAFTPTSVIISTLRNKYSSMESVTDRSIAIYIACILKDIGYPKSCNGRIEGISPSSSFSSSKGKVVRGFVRGLVERHEEHEVVVALLLVSHAGHFHSASENKERVEVIGLSEKVVGFVVCENEKGFPPKSSGELNLTFPTTLKSNSNPWRVPKANGSQGKTVLAMEYTQSYFFLCALFVLLLGADTVVVKLNCISDNCTDCWEVEQLKCSKNENVCSCEGIFLTDTNTYCEYEECCFVDEDYALFLPENDCPRTNTGSDGSNNDIGIAGIVLGSLSLVATICIACIGLVLTCMGLLIAIGGFIIGWHECCITLQEGDDDVYEDLKKFDLKSWEFIKCCKSFDCIRWVRDFWNADWK